MQKKKQLQHSVLAVLAFALLFMGVGFLSYLQIVKMDHASALSSHATYRKVGFIADSYREGDGSVLARSKMISSKSIDFSVRLERPGDFYSAMVNVRNDGEVEEVLREIRMSAVDQKNVEYTVSFGNEDYLGTSYNINQAITLGELGREQLFIYVGYEKDAPASGPLNLDLSVGLSFAD